MGEIDASSHKILRALSENSRFSYNELAKRAGCSPQTAKKRVKWLEKEFGIKYVLEFDEEKIGLSAAYITYAKFKSMPDTALLKKLLQKHAGPQFAAITKGDFDFIVYFSGRSNLDFSKWANWFRQQLSEYITDWQPSHTTGFWFGFFPLSLSTVAGIPLEGPKKKMLMTLAENARMPLEELAKKCGIPPSTAHYHLYSILNAGYVKRCTMIMQKSDYPITNIDTHGYHIGKEFWRRNLQGRNALLNEETGLSASNQLIASFNGVGAFDDILFKSFEKLEDCQAHNEMYTGFFSKISTHHKSAIVMNVIQGALPVRNLDVKREYNQKLEMYDLLEKD